jgi:hypothetical protein
MHGSAYAGKGISFSTCTCQLLHNMRSHQGTILLLPAPCLVISWYALIPHNSCTHHRPQLELPPTCH